MIIAQIGNLFLCEFIKDPFWDLCFLIYINDLLDLLRSNAKLFVD